MNFDHLENKHIKIHYELQNKILEKAPSSRKKGDIDFCITKGEKALKNLKNFMRSDFLEYENLPVDLKENRGYIAPSIPFADILINCYLMLDKFDDAERVILNVEKSNAKLSSDYKEAQNRVKNIQQASVELKELIKQKPGVLQKDIYKILFEVNKEALRWYVSNSRMIHKEPINKTYSIWLTKEDVSIDFLDLKKEDLDKKQVKEIKQKENQLQLIEKPLEFAKQDNYYISISFGESTSKNFSKALQLANTSSKFIEYVDDRGNKVYQAFYTERTEDFLNFIQLYELINSWKSTFVFINNKLTDRKIVQGINYCYGDKCRSNKTDFCFGASEFTANPFGCHRLQISRSNNPWWSFSIKKGKRYVIEKEKIRERIKEYSKPYLNCPSLDIEFSLNVVNQLPNSISEKQYQEYEYGYRDITPKLITPQKDLNQKKTVESNGFLSKILSIFKK